MGQRGATRSGRPRSAVRNSALVAVVLALALTACGASQKGKQHSASGPPSTPSAPTLAGDGPGGSSGAATTPPTTKPPTTLPSTPSSPGAVKEVTRTCPYIGTQSLADTVGSRVGRTTVLLSTPPGCRFYLPFGDFHAVAQIAAKTYADETTAHNAMITSTAHSSERIGVPTLTSGVEAILFRTAFYKPDGARDWACTFRKGKTVVTVNTDQNDTSFNARQIAIKVAPKF